MNADQFRAAAHAAIEDIISYHATLESRPVVAPVSPGYLAPQMPTSAPAAPEGWDTIRPDIESLIMPGLTHWQHPNFMAFFPSNSSYPAILGELYSAALSAPAFNWLCSPAITELETVVLDWVAKAIGLPAGFLSSGEGGGVIQGSASEAIVTVMVAARERMLRRRAEGCTEEAAEAVKDAYRGRLVALGSSQAHSSTHKGAIIAGTKFRSVTVRLEDEFAMTGEGLKAALLECKAEGLVPYYLTVSLGTTATCAVDQFAEIAEVLKEWPDVWVHVDAAYAGAALVCPEYQHFSAQFGAFDSFDFNMHKWLLTNFDASCLFIQKRSDLTSALSITPSYLRNEFSDSGLVTDYRDWQIPLGRRFRALKIWFVLRSYGLEGLRAHIRRHITLGKMFAELVESRGDLFFIITPPAFALTVLTVRPFVVMDFKGDGNLEAGNRLTKKVADIIAAKGEAFLTSSTVEGVVAIRVVAGTPAVEEHHLRRVFDLLVEAAEEVVRQERNRA
ncbi:hypothetical protein EJ06DRAFT_481338 [Trichodelitschia bisporula]|uniref:Aromatic-L-amino-acid decarboxylase n=1 Tax=Trichodelitschia bisporula TaxID=703511 RepID=A0A6G1HNZ3_9PEZI|nr:hypothetical protein EJ06DRAFT_481338 [Trichodelitschia bisporula]